MRFPITRREFLKDTALAAAAFSTSPLDLQAASPKTLERTGAPKKVIVVGAGLAGLSAAFELTQAGHDVTILEAQTRPGGRVYTLRKPFSDGLYAEAGGQVFLPFNPDHAMAYIKRFGLSLRASGRRDLANLYYFRQSRIRYTRGEEVDWPLELTPEERRLGVSGMRRKYMEPAVEELWNAANAGWPGDVFERYDKLSYADMLRERGASAAAIELLSILYWDFWGEGANSYSALQGLLEWASDRWISGESYAIKGGNDLLPKAFAAQLKDRIRYGAPAARIEHDAQGVRVFYLQGGTHLTVSGDYLVCATPFSVLRHLEISPPFSLEKMRAIREVPYAAVCLLYLQARKKFWVEEGLSGFARTDLPTTYLWESTWGQEGPRGILQGWVAGPHARRVETMTEDARMRFAVEQIKKLFPKVEQHLEGGASICWGEEPWALGHNSWSRPGQGASLFAHTARPEGRVHFAGEHTAPWPLRGFMHGALESGIRAAREVNEAG